MPPNAVRAVSKMNLLLSLLLASRAGAVGLREGRANDNALVEPGPHEYVPPKDGTHSQLERAPDEDVGKKSRADIRLDLLDDVHVYPYTAEPDMPRGYYTEVDEGAWLSEEEAEAVKLEKEAALEVKIKTQNGYMRVAPAVDADGKPMTIRQVLRACYTDSLKSTEDRLYQWDHAAGAFNKDKPFQVERWFTSKESIKADVSAVRLYTFTAGKGGSYEMLNSLLSQSSISVPALLLAYNADPREGKYLKGRRCWLHVFRLAYHTVAEMQLRNAQIAIYNRHRQLQAQQKQLLQVLGHGRAGRWRVFEPSRALRAVWNSPKFDTAEQPALLYRGMCVSQSAKTPHPFSLDFYQRGHNTIFPYRGFTSTSAKPDAPIKIFAKQCHAPKIPLIAIIDPKDATPCYLDESMSHLHKTEAEYLFRPYTYFKITHEAHPCPFSKTKLWCVQLSYVRQHPMDPIKPRSVGSEQRRLQTIRLASRQQHSASAHQQHSSSTSSQIDDSAPAHTPRRRRKDAVVSAKKKKKANLNTVVDHSGREQRRPRTRSRTGALSAEQLEDLF